MTEERVTTGGCLCGAIRYRITGEPKRVSNCNCRNCQKANAAVYVTGAAFDPAHLTFTGGEPAYYRSSAWAQRSFCPSCGGQIAFHYDDGEAISVWVPTMDDPNALPPMRTIWTEHRIGWVPFDTHLPEFPCEGARPIPG